jgi:hypothetical protein
MKRYAVHASLALLVLANACSSTTSGSGMPDEERALRNAGCTTSVCVRAGSAGCWTAQPLESACRSCEHTYGQGWAASVWTGCKAEFDSYAACLRKSEFYCKEPGVAAPVSCDAARAAADACLSPPAADAGATPDGAADAGDAPDGSDAADAGPDAADAETSDAHAN